MDVDELNENNVVPILGSRSVKKKLKKNFAQTKMQHKFINCLKYPSKRNSIA